MKKSLAEALERGLCFSLEHMGVTVWVMDRPRKQAIISSVDWVMQQRILEGWHVEAVFKNGERIR